jgi:hypothetical protein
MPDDGSVEAGAGEVWLGGRDDNGRPLAVSCSATERLLVDLDGLLPPPGAAEQHRVDWFRIRAILLDIVARGLAGTDPASARLAAGLAEESLAEAGLEFAGDSCGRRRDSAVSDPRPWLADMESLLARYRREYPAQHPRRVTAAQPPQSTDPQRYRQYFRLTDPTTRKAPDPQSPAVVKAIWQAHRAEHLEAVAAHLAGQGLCGADLARRAAAGARAAANRAALGY